MPNAAKTQQGQADSAAIRHDTQFTRDEVRDLVQEILDDHAVRIVGVICAEQPSDKLICSLLDCLDACRTEAVRRLEGSLCSSEPGATSRPTMLGPAVQAFRHRISKYSWDLDIQGAGGA